MWLNRLSHVNGIIWGAIMAPQLFTFSESPRGTLKLISNLKKTLVTRPPRHRILGLVW